MKPSLHPPVGSNRRLTAMVALLALATCSIALAACGQPQAETSASATPDSATPTLTGTPPAGAPTPVPGLTDTGYKARDGSPLYAECIGTNPATGQPLPLPPEYATPSALAPLPSPPADPNPNPRPAMPELPAFDPLAVGPADASSWDVVSSDCGGGISFAVPPGMDAVHPFAFGNYDQNSGAIYATGSSGAKVDISYFYEPVDDVMARFRNRPAGNGVYFLSRNEPVTVGGASGLIDVSSDVIDSPNRYVTISALVTPKPGWYFSFNAFVDPPFLESTVANIRGMLSSVRFGPQP